MAGSNLGVGRFVAVARGEPTRVEREALSTIEFRVHPAAYNRAFAF